MKKTRQSLAQRLESRLIKRDDGSNRCKGTIFFLTFQQKSEFFQSKRKNIQKQEKIKDYNQSIMCQRDGFAIW